MTLKLYFDLMSQPVRAVYMFLKATGIDFVECPVALRKGEHLTPEFEKVNPLKKVPAIDDDGFLLTESVAILKYLALKHKVPDHWYPADIKKQARVDEFLSWQHMNLRAHGAQYFLTRVLFPKPVNEAKLQRHKDDLDRCLDDIERVFLRNNSKFINGLDDISIADLFAVAEMEQPMGANYDVLANRPILTAYVNRVRGRLQPHYDFAHQFIRKVREGVIKGKL